MLNKKIRDHILDQANKMLDQAKYTLQDCPNIYRARVVEIK